MRAKMMEEVRAQLLANQELMKDESQSSWEEQVGVTSHHHKLSSHLLLLHVTSFSCFVTL